jgi:flagellar basal body-associated protein FliL
MAQKSPQKREKSIAVRILVLIVAVAIFAGFIILPLLQA